MMLYVSIGTLFWTHIFAAVFAAIASSIYVYWVMKK